jgi:biotin synthase
MYLKSEIIEMLELRREEQRLLFNESRSKKSKYMNPITLRGVIEITNICRVNCDYCPMRRDNQKYLKQYLLEEDEILEAVKRIYEQGIRVVFFQGGEIPQTTKLIGDIIPKVKELFKGNVEVLLSLGIKTKQEYKFLKEQGADSYIMKFETSNPNLHQKLRHETFQNRLNNINHLIDLGYNVGTGMIVSLPGQTMEDLAKDILFASSLNVKMVSASPFIPAINTPLEQYKQGSLNTTLNAIAIMRILNPKRLIPSVSALEKIEKGGQAKGIDAGANVLTINFTPHRNKENYLIYGQDRFVSNLEHIYSIKNGSNIAVEKQEVFN